MYNLWIVTTNLLILDLANKVYLSLFSKPTLVLVKYQIIIRIMDIIIIKTFNRIILIILDFSKLIQIPTLVHIILVILVTAQTIKEITNNKTHQDLIILLGEINLLINKSSKVLQYNKDFLVNQQISRHSNNQVFSQIISLNNSNNSHNNKFSNKIKFLTIVLHNSLLFNLI